jgi:flagellar biosynthetic protein FliR
MLPPLVRVGVSIALSVPMTPAAAEAAGTVPTTPGPLAWAAIEQVLIGGFLGLVCLTLLSAVQSAGSLIDVVGGFSMAQGFDPLLMQQNAVMSRIYGLVAGVLLLVTGGYMVLLQGFAATFEALPITGTLDLAASGATLSSALSMMITATLQIAAPIVGVAFLADVALGLMSRVAPALNAFALGFPIKIGLTLMLLAFTVPMLPPAVLGLSEQAVQAMAAITGGG